MEQTFWDKHKVFILGLLASISIVLQQYVGQAQPDTKVLLYAVVMTVLSYLASKWRGQGLSIIGIVGTLAGVFVTENETGNFTWFQFGLQATIAVIAAAAPDPKSRGYEHSETITAAKKEGNKLMDAPITSKPEE